MNRIARTLLELAEIAGLVALVPVLTLVGVGSTMLIFKLLSFFTP